MNLPELDPFAQALTTCFEADDPGVAAKALEQANVRAVVGLFQNLGRADLDAFIDGVTDDVELEIQAPAEFPFTRRATGRHALRAAIEHNFGALADQQPEVLNLVAQGNCIVLIGRERGRLRASDAPYDTQFVYEFMLRAGKVSRIRELAVPTT